MEFYPRELWTHSPVHRSYVPLFICDIHNLQSQTGEFSGVHFWSNHPVKWVQVIGVVVAITKKEENDVLLCAGPSAKGG
jgi:Telomere regulation protein Stn1